MKRSYNQKSEDCPDGSIENQRPTAQSGWPRTNVPLGQISVRLKSRPKFKPPADHASRPGKHVPRSAKPTTHASRARPCARAGNKPRGRATFAYHGRCAVRAGKDVPHVRETSANLHPSDHSRPTVNRPRPFRSFRHATTRCPADRPDRPSNAAVDPKPVLKPVSLFSRPGLTLSRL
ncbi:unnamed protein product [Microthlaspi erraticum]|uniref:Uncharacterized protein n=1 Tax=Microthlaspi erraticum TaxID=1685480 RepID=A0A6D2JLP3_9BRAS|nr:unnamed protein product [Microthlaspi erraticum]